MTLWTSFAGASIERETLGGVATRIVRAGAGEPPIVLLHGRGGHLETWRDTIAPLAERRSVVAFDLLGHGLTDRREGSDYGVLALTEHAEAVIDELGLHRIVLVGQSLGGWVAAQLALRRPDLVATLVLVEPAGFETEDERRQAPGFQEAFRRGGRAFDEPTVETVRDRLEGLVADPGSIDDEIVETRLALYTPPAAREVHKLVRTADNASAVLSPEVMARLDMPVLVIHGESSHTPLAVIESALEGCPSARVVTVPATRQWPQWERPDIVNELLLHAAGVASPEPLRSA